jgi:hypothetical protein
MFNEKTGALQCDMTTACTCTVTHIDNKGYSYCASHGAARKQSVPCRKLTRAEIERLKAGLTIRYSRT